MVTLRHRTRYQIRVNDFGPGAIKHTLMVPAHTLCRPCDDGTGQWWVDDLSWLPTTDFAYHDADHYGIRLDAANVEPAPLYRPGEIFHCWRRPVTFDPDAPTGNHVGPVCNAEIRMHNAWWCAQVCPKCLANYHTLLVKGQDIVTSAFGSYYPPEAAQRVRDNIVRNGGQYIPEF